VEAVASRLWETSLGQLQMQVSKANYDTWLRDTKGISFDGQTFVVGVATDFAREWLNTKLRGPVMKTIANVVGSTVDVSFVVANANRTPAIPVETTPAPSVRRARTNLLSRQTFENFVVGEANRFAATAAREVAQGQGAYNPLFIHGGVGQGKTHLLHAIGNVAAASGANVLYAPADQFLREFVMSLQKDGEEEFRQKYRGLDVLLLDDFQFLVGKDRTEEEFLHTFNALQNNERQIVITCDRTPKLFTSLSDRIRTRLEGGLLVEVKAPDPWLRAEFLRKRMQDKDVVFPPEVIQYLSDHFKLSIRELEGAFIQVLALAGMARREITIELAMEATAGLASPQNKARPSCDRVLGVVCRYFEVTLDKLRCPSREKHITYARQVAMLLMRDDCQKPLAEIGQLLGGRDHSTILHGANKIAAAEMVDQRIRYDLHEIRQVLAQPIKAA
jgi:chromosomal replication initiator protein